MKVLKTCGESAVILSGGVGASKAAPVGFGKAASGAAAAAAAAAGTPDAKKVKT